MCAWCVRYHRAISQEDGIPTPTNQTALTVEGKSADLR